MNEQERHAEEQRARQLSDRDLLVGTAVEVKAIKATVEELKENGCQHFPDINRQMGEHEQQITTLFNRQTERGKNTLVIIAIIIAAASLLVTLGVLLNGTGQG